MTLEMSSGLFRHEVDLAAQSSRPKFVEISRRMLHATSSQVSWRCPRQDGTCRCPGGVLDEVSHVARGS